MLLHEVTGLDIGMPCQGADLEVVTRVANATKGLDATDIHEQGGTCQAQLHQGDQRVPSCQQLGILGLSEEPHGIRGRACDFVVELCGNHLAAS